MVQAAEPQPGEQVLELAAGVGETGLLAAELIAPVGKATISDQAEAMLDGARARAGELGITNVEFKVLNAEWIDLPLACIDVVLCRWGYMLMADPLAALAESRRVLRPGGRLALAIWDSIELNPWAKLPTLELGERGFGSPPSAPGAPPRPGEERRPGPFSLGDPGLVEGLLADSGFTDITLEAVDILQRHESFEDDVGRPAGHLAQLSRRRDVAPGRRDRGDQGLARAALRALPARSAGVGDPRPDAGRSRRRLTVASVWIACRQ